MWETILGCLVVAVLLALWILSILYSGRRNDSLNNKWPWEG